MLRGKRVYIPHAAVEKAADRGLSASNVSFAYECPRGLAQLEDLGIPGEVHCHTCRHSVYRCGGDARRANALGAAGLCVEVEVQG